MGATFATEEAARLSTAFDVSSFLIRALFFADELEPRRRQVPAEGVRLALDGGPPAEDAFHCALKTIVAAIQHRPGVTRAELEKSFAPAPVKIRLALAMLSETEAIAGRALLGHESEGENAASRWWSTRIAEIGGTVRILITGEEGQFSAASFSRLAERLTSLPPPISVQGEDR